ncbi:MAG: NADH-quinone oxidoreductase subunit M [Myxococcales bacterium]|nr:NADH-quinone oxidoreductase subunit M [Myxococcales bacterium]
MDGSFLLPLLIGLPVVGALLVMVSPKGEGGLARMLGLSFSLITFLVSLGVFAYFRANLGGMQLVFDTVWVSSLGIHFKTGIDGISLWLLILTTFMTPLTLFAAKGSIDKHVREFVAAMLLLEAGMIGSFVALDLFVFYVFYEIMLVPMYLLIGIWGGQRRIYASIKFFVFTMVGSLLMLAAIIFLYVTHGQVTGTYTSDLEALSNLILPHQAQVWCFAAFALAFAIKIPLFPVHTWLPDAHVEAPTPGSVILAGVMLKFGIYGFLRFAMPLFPAGAAELAPYIAVLAVIGIVYGALVAFSQDDVKKIVAYSSVSHLGFCALGLFAMTLTGIQGSIFAMLSHGLTTGGLFLGIGVLYERRHTRRLAEYGGIWKQMPIFAGLYLIVTMGSAGLPATSGFIGEFLTIFGTFTASNFPGNYSIPNPMLLGAFAATGVILGAIYLLYMFQKVFFGKLDVAKNGGLKDLNGRELAVFVILCVGIIGMGVAPHRILKSMEPSVQTFVRNFGRGVSEPDGPARLYGTPVPSQPRAAKTAPVAQLGVGQ